MIQYLRSGVLYTAMGKYSNVLIQLIINAVLSRLLNPYDYGVVSVIQVFLLFFTTLADAGLGPAIIQNKALTPHDNRVLFTYSIILSLMLGVIFAACSPLIAWFYHDGQYIPLTLSMCLVLVAQGLNMVPNALMDKAKRFKEVNIRLVIANLAGGVAGIVSAFCGLGAYALIISFLVPPVIAFALNMWLLRIRPARRTDRRSLDKIFQFAKSQFGFNSVVLVGTTVIGCAFGDLVSLSISLSVGFVLNFIVIYWMMMVKTLDSDFWLLLRQFVKPFLIGVILFAVMFGVKMIVPDLGTFTNLVIYGFVYVLLFCIMMFVFGEWKLLYQFFVKDKRKK